MNHRTAEVKTVKGMPRAKSPPKSSSPTSSPLTSQPPPAPKPAAATSPPKPAPSPPAPTSKAATPPPPCTPPQASPPPAKAVDPEVHELAELFAAPARPSPPRSSLPNRSPPQKAASPPRLPVGYTSAWKEHLATSPRPESPSRKRPESPKLMADKSHTRAVISKYGGMLDMGSSLPVPPQPWEALSPRLAQSSVDAHAARTGGSRSGWSNNTKFDAEPSFRARSPTGATVLAAGVPGYMGHIPVRAAAPPSRPTLKPDAAAAHRDAGCCCCGGGGGCACGCCYCCG